MDLLKVIDLFESKHTAGLADRQATAIIQLCKGMVNEDSQAGFFYRELPQLARVLELIHDRLSKREVSHFRQLLYSNHQFIFFSMI